VAIAPVPVDEQESWIAAEEATDTDSWIVSVEAAVEKDEDFVPPRLPL
jgi:hypothetical protein